MTISIELPNEIQAKLQQKAAAAGVDVPTYAAKIIQADVQRMSLDELLRPVREAFEASGMTDDELAELIEKEKHAAREQKYGKKFSE